MLYELHKYYIYSLKDFLKKITFICVLVMFYNNTISMIIYIIQKLFRYYD